MGNPGEYFATDSATGLRKDAWMCREMVPGAGGRTLAVVLRSLASTGTRERSCLLGALCSMVLRLCGRMWRRIGGVANIGQQMTHVKEEKAGYRRMQQRSADEGSVWTAGQVSG
jgi:hypothetical protein